MAITLALLRGGESLGMYAGPMISADLLLSSCKFVSIIVCTGFFAVLALVRPYKDQAGTLTSSGRIALGRAIVSLIVAALSQSLELERSHRQALAAQKKTQDELARFEKLLREVQRSSPLLSLTVRLTVNNVPNDVIKGIEKGQEKARSSPSQESIVDLIEEHDISDDDIKALVQSELNKQVIQPFIVWLGSDHFTKEDGILAIGVDEKLPRPSFV